MKKYYIAFSIITVIVVGIVIYEFSVTAQKKGIKMDYTRMQDFSELSYSIQSYYGTNDKLPAALGDLGISSQNIKDPKTKKPYTYQIISDSTYKLCATFAEDSSKEPDNSDYLYFKNSSDTQVFASNENPIKAAQFRTPSPGATQLPIAPDQTAKTHKKGFDCITYDIPDYYLYPSQNKPIFVVPDSAQ